MVIKRSLILQLLCSFTIERILSKFNLTVRMVPGITAITVDPVLAVDLSIVGTTEIHLVAVVALLVVFETIVAPLTELHLLA